MAGDDPGEPYDESGTTDEWEEFRGGEPIRVAELTRLDLKNMPEDVCISIFDDYFPETTIRCSGDRLICEIQEHLYTKYWEHKFSAYAFAEAMERAVRRPRMKVTRSPSRHGRTTMFIYLSAGVCIYLVTPTLNWSRRR